MFLFFDLSIKLVGYLGFLIGIWLIVGKWIYTLIRNNIYISRFRRTVELHKHDGTITRLNMLLNVTVNRDNLAYSFLLLSLSIALISFIILFYYFGFSHITFLTSIFIGFIPYLFLRVRLINMRVDGSYEAITLITELANQYKINGFNMIEAIDSTIPYLANCRYSRRALFRLSLKLKDYRTREELEHAIEEFVFSSGTDWAALLGMNIFLSIHDGFNVAPALDDIIDDLKQIKVIIEKDKRNNFEAFAMIKYIVPLLYVSTVLIAVNFFDFSYEKFFYYQFGTPTGIKLMFFIIVLSIVNFICMLILKRPKFDF